MITALASDQPEFAGRDLDRDHALHPAVVDDQVDAEVLVEALDRRVLDRRLEQRVQHVEAGLVGGEPRALDLHAAEGAHVGVAVGRAAPRAAPVLHLHHLVVRMRDEILDHVLLAQPVAAATVSLKCCSRLSCGCVTAGGAAFGRHRVAAHRIDLGDAARRVSDGSASATAMAARSPAPPAPTIDDIGLEYFHVRAP